MNYQAQNGKNTTNNDDDTTDEKHIEIQLKQLSIKPNADQNHLPTGPHQSISKQVEETNRNSSKTNNDTSKQIPNGQHSLPFPILAAETTRYILEAISTSSASDSVEPAVKNNDHCIQPPNILLEPERIEAVPAKKSYPTHSTIASQPADFVAEAVGSRAGVSHNRSVPIPTREIPFTAPFEIPAYTAPILPAVPPLIFALSDNEASEDEATPTNHRNSGGSSHRNTSSYQNHSNAYANYPLHKISQMHSYYAHKPVQNISKITPTSIRIGTNTITSPGVLNPLVDRGRKRVCAEQRNPLPLDPGDDSFKNNLIHITAALLNIPTPTSLPSNRKNIPTAKRIVTGILGPQSHIDYAALSSIPPPVLETVVQAFKTHPEKILAAFDLLHLSHPVRDALSAKLKRTDPRQRKPFRRRMETWFSILNVPGGSGSRLFTDVGADYICPSCDFELFEVSSGLRVRRGKKKSGVRNFGSKTMPIPPSNPGNDAAKSSSSAVTPSQPLSIPTESPAPPTKSTKKKSQSKSKPP